MCSFNQADTAAASGFFPLLTMLAAWATMRSKLNASKPMKSRSRSALTEKLMAPLELVILLLLRGVPFDLNEVHGPLQNESCERC